MTTLHGCAHNHLALTNSGCLELVTKHTFSTLQATTHTIVRFLMSEKYLYICELHFESIQSHLLPATLVSNRVQH